MSAIDALHGRRARRDLHDADCIVSRSGYTGEDGFEISVPADKAEAAGYRCSTIPTCCRSGLAPAIQLRLEAGLCLYGNDIDTTTTPVEGALEWAIQKVRRKAARAPVDSRAPTRSSSQIEKAHPPCVGLKPEGRAPVRGRLAFADPRRDRSANRQGHLRRLRPEASMRPSPWATVPTVSLSAPGTALFSPDVRGRRWPITVCGHCPSSPKYKHLQTLTPDMISPWRPMKFTEEHEWLKHRRRRRDRRHHHARRRTARRPRVRRTARKSAALRRRRRCRRGRRIRQGRVRRLLLRSMAKSSRSTRRWLPIPRSSTPIRRASLVLQAEARQSPADFRQPDG
jgi:hypothetical protein